MEKIDVLFIAFVIFVIIVSCYIVYLKAGINFLLDTLVKHRTVIEKILEMEEAQHKINTAQDEYNTNIRKLLDILIHSSSPTGGEKQSN